MSGIAGVYAEAAPDPGLAQAMIRRLAHRGPVRQEVLAEGRVALAQAAGRAAGAGGLPLRSADGSLMLIADGALAGAAGLRARLEALGRRHEGRSDWELVLGAYAQYGDELLRFVEGTYALALYDRATRRLLLARDRVGARPLFLARTAGGWAFASELKGLLPALGTPAIDPRALAQCLQGRFSTGPVTLFAGVERLQPGELLILDDEGEAARKRYWSLLDVQPARLRYAEAAARFDRLAGEIAQEGEGAAAPGTLLLGGAPSALLLAVLSGSGATPARTLALGDEGTADDTAAARLAGHFGVRHETIRVTPADLIERLAAAAWAVDDLIFDLDAPARLALAETLAPGDGPLISAAGAGEVFGGEARYHGRRIHRWLDRLLDPSSGGFQSAGEFRGLERTLFGPALHRATQDWRAPYAGAWQACPSTWSELQRMQYLDLATLVPDRVLAALDRSLQSHGGDWRTPWLDRRMVELGLSLPDGLKSPGRHGGFLRRRAEELLPEGYGEWKTPPGRAPVMPLGAWLSGDTLDRLERVLSSSPPLRAWLQPQAVSTLAAMKRQDRPVAAKLGALLQFALWHRIFVEGGGERPERCDPLAFLEE